ncbi:MAG: hypothetical protein Q9173_001957 [Seirophora scorigena]
MAETLFDDDDDDLWIEDPYGEADDLAEHTMHSPVLVNYDPALESAEFLTDWDDDSDEFFDSESPRTKRRKINATGNEPKTPAKPKRQRLKSSRNVSELSLGDPAFSDTDQNLRSQSTVVWKSQGNSPRLPVLRQGQEDKVSILKDWRERFRFTPSLQSLDSKSRTSDGSQRAIAVVIQHQPTTNHTHKHTGATTPLLHSISKRKRRRGSQDNEDTHSTSQSENDHSNRPVTKKRKQRTSPPADAPTPVVTNGISRPKRKRKPDEPTSPQTQKIAPQKPSQNITTPAETHTDVDGEPEGKTTSPQSRNVTIDAAGGEEEHEA